MKKAELYKLLDVYRARLETIEKRMDQTFTLLSGGDDVPIIDFGEHKVKAILKEWNGKKWVKYKGKLQFMWEVMEN